MRLFIAINLNSDTRSRLLSLRDKVRSVSRSGNFVKPENLHLTLAFLGECDGDQVAAAKAAMDGVVFEPFDLSVFRLGVFKRQGGDIWWAGIREDRTLLNMQRDLSERLLASGFVVESRKYSPHITLGREVRTDDKPWQIEPFGEEVSKIDLMKSERIGGKLTYTSIYRRGKWSRPIVVEPYDAKWATEFARIRNYLMPHVQDLVGEIHHVGSTAVTGLPAKPIIDIDIEIPSAGSLPAVLDRLGKLGYRHQGDLGIPGREVLNRDRPDEFMRYHLYVCPQNSPELKRHLAFRDYLRVHPEAVIQYGDLKRRLAEEHGNDIDAYIDGKADFIRRILEAAKAPLF